MSFTDQYEKVIKQCVTAGPASQDAIERAEKELDVKFPLAYRMFLEQHGAAMGSGFEIAGLFEESETEPPMFRHIVSATKQARRASQGNLPTTLVPISTDGAGVTFYIDGVPAEDCPVLAYGPGVDGSQVADNIPEFVVRLAAEDLNI